MNTAEASNFPYREPDHIESKSFVYPITEI